MLRRRTNYDGTKKRKMGNQEKIFDLHNSNLIHGFVGGTCQMKVQEPIESVGVNAGAYEAECFIRNIPVSKTVIISEGKEDRS